MAARSKVVFIALFALVALLPGSRIGAAVPVAILGLNFTGSTLGKESFSVPPDCDGAIGPSHFVEFINGRYSVYNKTNGVRVQTMTDTSFWSVAGVTLRPGWAISDPRLIYDPAVHRWFAAQIDFDPTGTVNTNHFLLGISASGDPTGAWKAVTIPSDPGGTDFADFPTLGLDTNGVFLAGNMFDIFGNSVGSTLFSIPKASLLAASPTVSGSTWFGILAYSARGYILQPAVCNDVNTTESILAPASLGVNSATGRIETNSTLIGFSVQNAGGSGSATLTSSIFRNVPGYTAPINPPQPDGTSNLDDGDARLSAKIYRVGGVLFAVHNTELNGRAAVRWYRLSAINYTLLEAGTISDSQLDLFYPSIAANTNGNIVIGCNGSSLSTFVSCYALIGRTSQGVTTFGNPVLLKSGVASYHNMGSTSTSRWGDYSTTSVDPDNPSIFWTIQMYPSSHSAWSTQITQLITNPQPVPLTMARAGANWLLCWSNTVASFQLQSTLALSTNNSWSAVSQARFTNGNMVCVLTPNTGPDRFFRLILPP